MFVNSALKIHDCNVITLLERINLEHGRNDELWNIGSDGKALLLGHDVANIFVLLTHFSCYMV